MKLDFEDDTYVLGLMVGFIVVSLLVMVMMI